MPSKLPPSRSQPPRFQPTQSGAPQSGAPSVAFPHGGPLSRRFALQLSVLALPALAAACGGRDGGAAEPVVVAPLSYDYLTKLRLNVATLDIDDGWRPPYGAAEVSAYSPIPPVTALRQMAQDRIVTAGVSGRATFRIVDASIVRLGDRLQATFAVQLTVATTDGTRSGYAEARVLHTSQFPDDGDRVTLRNALYAITRATMDDMNVEFEFQVRRSLRDTMMTDDPQLAPPPVPVQSQDLGPPGSTPPPPALPPSAVSPYAAPLSGGPPYAAPPAGGPPANPLQILRLPPT